MCSDLPIFSKTVNALQEAETLQTGTSKGVISTPENKRLLLSVQVRDKDGPIEHATRLKGIYFEVNVGFPLARA